jgi:hypothetical protein
MKTILRVLAVLLISSLSHADALDDLARDFWAWRATEQPVSFDDIPRLERSAEFIPDWSPDAVDRYRSQLQRFEEQWKGIDASGWPLARQVDYRLMGSALARAHWELEVLRSWQRNPTFYVDQTVGAYFHLLLAPPPFNAVRTRNIVATMGSIPQTVEYAKKNLTDPLGPFAQLAIDQLQDIGERMPRSIAALKPLLDAGAAGDLDGKTKQAMSALQEYREWLKQRLPKMSNQTAAGRVDYIFFLKNVALLPYTPEQILAMGHQEWARSVASQTYEEHRNEGAPQLALFKDQAEQIAHEQKDEQAVRKYLEDKNILTVPDWAQHYTFAPNPAYIAAFGGIGEADYFTGPSHLKENGIRYIDAPSSKLGYFALATAKDPRGEIVHEGIPGHYFQLVLSWANPDPVRRHYYDSSANEGIGFYAEEMMLDAGLFDDSPRTREIIWNFMRLRALRVEVDVKLALGEFSIDQGAEYLKNTVPMDAGTAHAEAAFFASTPGQAISYEIGKLQIYNFLAEARRQKKDAFSLRDFHDFLWVNGNVPIALQRWEYLGLRDEVDGLR